jgi:hypothetical protein
MHALAVKFVEGKGRCENYARQCAPLWLLPWGWRNSSVQIFQLLGDLGVEAVSFVAPSVATELTLVADLLNGKAIFSCS